LSRSAADYLVRADVHHARGKRRFAQATMVDTPLSGSPATVIVVVGLIVVLIVVFLAVIATITPTVLVALPIETSG
jgi:hypothetical protein